MTPIRLASNLSAAVVAGIAAWSSYHHMVEVALSVGERADVAYVLPLSVDGMLVVASTAMVDDRRSNRRVRWSARLAFLAGVGASVGANVAAAEPTVGARIVAAWPAVALLLTVELLSRTGRLLTRHESITETAEPAEASALDVPVVEQVSTPEALPVPAPEPVPAKPVKPALTRRQIKAAVKDPRRTPRRPDGTVSVRSVTQRYPIGFEGARDLLIELELYRANDAGTALDEATGEHRPVNGHDHSEGIASLTYVGL